MSLAFKRQEESKSLLGKTKTAWMGRVVNARRARLCLDCGYVHLFVSEEDLSALTTDDLHPRLANAMGQWIDE